MDTRFPALAPQAQTEPRALSLARLPLTALPLGEMGVFGALVLLMLWA